MKLIVDRRRGSWRRNRCNAITYCIAGRNREIFFGRGDFLLTGPGGGFLLSATGVGGFSFSAVVGETVAVVED